MNMGGRNSKSAEPEGPIVELMRQKHGETCLECLPYWSREFGFPENGSLSAAKLKMLRADLDGKLKQMKSGKKVRVKDLDRIVKNRTCLIIWEKECEYRERKQIMKHMTCLKEEKKGVVLSKDVDTPETHTPSDNPSLFSSSMYPSLTGAGGPLLDVCPRPSPRPVVQPDPRPPPPPPPPVHGPKAQTDTRQHREQQRVALHSNAMYQQYPSSPPSASDPFSDHPQHSTPSGSSVFDPSTWSGSAGRPADVLSQNNPLNVKPEDKFILSAPMIQVPGAEGVPGLVFRAWTQADILLASSHLPSIHNGTAFAKDFLIFCKEFMPTGPEVHRLLVKHAGPSDFSKIRAVVTGEGVSKMAAQAEFLTRFNPTNVSTVAKLVIGTMTVLAISTGAGEAQERRGDVTHSAPRNDVVRGRETTHGRGERLPTPGLCCREVIRTHTCRTHSHIHLLAMKNCFARSVTQAHTHA